MNDFKYILDNIKEAEFISDPFPHLEIESFLSEEHLETIINDNQVHFDPSEDNDALYETLTSNDWEVQQFPGCIPNWTQYISYLNNPSKAKTGPDVGITFRLKNLRNSLIRELIAFMNGGEFHQALKEKFQIGGATQIISAIQKNLTGYEISPHPDIRQKALTYLLNINKNKNIETKDCHTHLLRFKPEHAHTQEYWEANPKVERGWAPWQTCNTVKTINANNTMVMFRPNSSPASLHGVKLDYNHLEYQRTQIYGNLMFEQDVNSAALQAINVLG